MKTIRRLYFYLVSLVSLEVVAWALISLARSIFDESLSDVLAGGVAFILVGLPVFLFHWRVVQREAASDREERFSGVRAVFLYAAWIGLAVPVVQNLLAIVMRLLAVLFEVNRQIVSVGAHQNWIDNIVAILVNGLLAAYIYSILKKDWQAEPAGDSFPLVRRLNRYLWVLYGLVMAFTGSIMLLEFIFEQTGSVGYIPENLLVDALSMLIVGVPLWVYSWNIVQRIGKPSLVRTATLYALTLLSALAALLSLGNALLIVLRTLFVESISWPTAWGDLGIVLSVLIPSTIVWIYHWSVFKRDIKGQAAVQRHTQRRVYFYVLSLAGLVATFIALQFLVALLVDTFVCSPGSEDYFNTCQTLLEFQLPNVIAILMVSVPVWLLHWQPVQNRAILETEMGESARASLLRKSYLYLILFAGVLGSMVSTGWVLYELISSLLGIAAEGSLRTILTLVGTLILFIVFTVYHWRILRIDNKMLDETTAARHRAFPVVIISDSEGFAQVVKQAVNALAPEIPLIIQDAGKPLAEEIGEAKAVILSSAILIEAGAPLKTWLDSFEGSRLVLPSEREGWLWLGLTDQTIDRQVRQAVQVIRRLAEASDTKTARSLSPAAVVGYVVGAMVGLVVLCIIGSVLLEMFA